MGWGGFLLADRKGGAREKRTMGKAGRRQAGARRKAGLRLSRATQPNTVFAVPPGR